MNPNTQQHLLDVNKSLREQVDSLKATIAVLQTEPTSNAPRNQQKERKNPAIDDEQTSNSEPTADTSKLLARIKELEANEMSFKEASEAMRQKQDELERRVGRLTKETERLEEALKSSKKEREARMAMITRLKEGEKKSSAPQSAFKKLQAGNKMLREQVILLKEKIAKQASAHEQQLGTINQLREMNAELTTTDSKQQVQQLENKLKKERDKLRLMDAKHTDELVQLRTKLENKVVMLEHSNKVDTDIKIDLAKRLERLLEENALLKEKVGFLENSIQLLTAERRSYRSTIGPPIAEQVGGTTETPTSLPTAN